VEVCAEPHAPAALAAVIGQRTVRTADLVWMSLLFVVYLTTLYQ
jgi:hypothetical protein